MTGGVYWSIIISGLFLVSMQEAKESKKRITYFSTEHPRIVYYDTKYSNYMNVTSRRHSRTDPFYYVDFHISTLMPIGDNVTASFYFYELLTNVYKRGFIEMHMGVCDLILNDKFFGGAMRRNFNTAQLHCPFPKSGSRVKEIKYRLEKHQQPIRINQIESGQCGWPATATSNIRKKPNYTGHRGDPKMRERRTEDIMAD